MREDFKAIGELNDTNKIRVKFLPFQEFMTDEQKLIIIEKRKDLGLDTMVDTLMRDNPDLSKQQAEEKLKEILKEKIEKNMALFMEQKEEQEDDKDELEEDQEEDKKEEDEKDKKE